MAEPQTRGIFITFEGIDGCGKSTQLALAQQWLTQQKVDVVVTREPGGIPISEKIRAILLAPEHAEMCNQTELLLYTAARAQHVAQLIRPALDNGQIVLCDRFEAATFAYQGNGRGFDKKQISLVNTFATGGVSPDLTMIFDLTVECASDRMSRQRATKDRLESNPRSFYERIREGYLQYAAAHPDSTVLVNASGAMESVAADVREHIARKISVVQGITVKAH